MERHFLSHQQRKSLVQKPEKQPSVDTPPPLAPTYDDALVLTLQRSIGNRATIQRLMSENELSNRVPQQNISRVGRLVNTKKSKAGIELNSARAEMFSAVHVVHAYLKGIVSHRREALRQQLTDIMEAYDHVVFAAQQFRDLINDENDPRSVAALELRVQATNEKSAALEKFLQRIHTPPNNVSMPTTVFDFIGVGQGRVYMDSARVTGEVGGGMNKLTKYATAQLNTEYFKPNTAQLDAYQNLDQIQAIEMDSYGKILNDLMMIAGKNIESGADVEAIPDDQLEGVNFGPYKDKATFARAVDQHVKKSLNTEFAQAGGINLQDLRSSQREVAMSRLATLLGSDLISKATLALRKTGSNPPQLGSVAPEAPGKDITKYNIVANAQQHPGPADTIRKDDPTLLSKLSGLLLIDFLAGQVDRHQGNYMIHVNSQGQVIGITGIDNDMSFGTRNANELAAQGGRELPPIGIYFDEDMANRILTLEAPMLRAAMTDLLNPAEIQALIQRLNVLKAKLRDAQAANKLLQPNQWAQFIASAPNDFDNSHYAKQVLTKQ